MDNQNNSESQQNWEQLKNKIEVSQNFPSEYMFKFILFSNNQKIAQIEALFNNIPDCEIFIRESSRGRYVSITVKQMVQSVEYIIEIYKKVSKIQGVMML